ncbi:MAG: addiction module protein [Nitrospiraceae bacterium]|nr:addiction module protein [Nitrospiraceae bacterium]
MHGMKEIIEEAEALPVEERAIVIDSLLRTLNPPSAEIDAEWAEVAKARLSELRSGRVKAVPGDQVFSEIRARFEK